MGSLAVIAPASAAADREAVLRALRAAPHRGDALEVGVLERVGFGVSNDNEFVDSSLARDAGWMAAFSGTLDNARELATELAREGVAVASTDPAGILLALSRSRGGPAPERLRGHFAAAVSDGDRLWCFRDQLGLRSLFFHANGRGFVAASEGKQVAAGAGIAREPDVEAVERAFWDRLGERETVLKGVQRFPRASTATVTAGHVGFEQYWQPSRLLETARLSVEDACDRLGELLDQAMRRATTGNDAVMLSGGIDSPAIAAYAAPRHLELGERPLQAVSFVYPDHPRVDEERYVRMVSDHLGLRLHTYGPQARALDDIERWVDVLDGPTNVILIPEVAESYRHARSHGARTVMNGELAEFVFTQSQHLIGHLLLHGRWGAALRWARAKRATGRSWQMLAREALVSVVPAPVADGYLRRQKPPPQVADWLIEKGSRRRYDLTIPARRRWSHYQLLPFTSPVVSFEAADVCAAVCGVHERKPLGDIDLWEFLLSLRAETKFPDLVWKSLLRRTLRGRLPDPILDRRDKTAFDDWIVGMADYDGIRRTALSSEHRIAGIDYARLAERVDRRDLGPFELIWAYDLARAHAFLNLWA